MKFTETDVLVVGGGMAGCRAALRSKDFVEKVTLVDKAVVARSGATIYGHEIIASVPEDSFKEWMEEVVLFTEYLSDQEWVEILLKANEARNFVLMVKLYHISSSQRKESRLRHYREEYPYRNDIDWLKCVVLRKEEEGVRIEFEPIPINNYPIRPDKLDKISAPIKFSYQ